MNIPTKTLKSGFELPVYGLGLWQMGGREERSTVNDEQDIIGIKAAIEHGVTHIDTAESYGDGHAEELLGEALKGYDRDKLFIGTKVSRWNMAGDGIQQAIERSLKRMGTDRVDLYMLHRYPDADAPIADVMRAMDGLVSQGLVKNIGVCNCTIERFEEAQKHSQNKLVVNQLHYNVQMREIEKEGLLDYCQQNDVMLVAWRPMQKGNLPKTELIDELAAKYGKTPNQVMINWVLSQESVVTLAKTSRVEHLEENLGGVGWTMEKEDIERIREEFPDQKFRSEAVPLNY